MLGALTAKIEEYLVGAFAEFVKGQSQRLITAAEDTADGITLKFTIAHPAGLKQLCNALLQTGQTTGLADAIRSGNKPDIRVEVEPGHKHG